MTNLYTTFRYFLNLFAPFACKNGNMGLLLLSPLIHILQKAPKAIIPLNSNHPFSIHYSFLRYLSHRSC